MPESKRNEEIIEEDLVEGAEDLEPDLEAGAIEEPTGEEEVTTAEAEAAVEGEEAGQKITVSVTEAPSLEGLQPNDEIDLITTYRVVRSDGENFDLDVIDFMPTEEIEAPEPTPEPTPAVPPGGGIPPGGAPPGAGLAGLV